MKTLLIKSIVKLIPVDWLAKLLAVCIARILNYASAHGGKAWDISKKTLKQTEIWIKLFNEVYEDDTLDSDEEAKIAAAIENMTAVKKIKNIIETDDAEK